jgi:molybdopterin-guanine dinucleotide biosynthesis protein MobB
MAAPEIPPAVAIVGWKNSGKTTLTVALAAELRRRGLRVASIKHGHHDFEIDQPGRDSWRHFHEGQVEAVLLAGGGKLAMVMRTGDAEPDPVTLVQRFYAGSGYDLVLVEGFKSAPLPKLEVFRQALREAPLLTVVEEAGAATFLAIVTDDPDFTAAIPVVPLGSDLVDGPHVRAVADIVVGHIR